MRAYSFINIYLDNKKVNGIASSEAINGDITLSQSNMSTIKYSEIVVIPIFTIYVKGKVKNFLNVGFVRYVK